MFYKQFFRSYRRHSQNRSERERPDSRDSGKTICTPRLLIQRVTKMNLPKNYSYSPSDQYTFYRRCLFGRPNRSPRSAFYFCSRSLQHRPQTSCSTLIIVVLGRADLVTRTTIRTEHRTQYVGTYFNLYYCGVPNNVMSNHVFVDVQGWARTRQVFQVRRRAHHSRSARALPSIFLPPPRHRPPSHLKEDRFYFKWKKIRRNLGVK